MFVPMEEIEKALADYKLQKQTVSARNDEPEIVAKVKQYEHDVRAEYAAKKQAELRDIDISIEAVERIKARAKEEEKIENQEA